MSQDIGEDRDLRRSWITFGFRAVENGFLFTDYDVGTDTIKTTVARDVSEFKSLLLKWQADRIGQIVEWAEKKQANFK